MKTLIIPYLIAMRNVFSNLLLKATPGGILECADQVWLESVSLRIHDIVL